MDEITLKLPIRLAPRKGQQVGMLLFFAVFFGFSLAWMAAAAGILDLDNGAIRAPETWAGSAFALFGLPFALVGLGGMATALLKMRRNSPHYHLGIDAQGLTIRELFTFRRFAWDQLPSFETIKVEHRTMNGRSTSHYTVAMEIQPDQYQRELLRIRADDFGAWSGAEDAETLTAWFNRLRGLARDRQLEAAQSVEVPEPFRATAIALGTIETGSAARFRTPVQPGRQTVDRQ